VRLAIYHARRAGSKPGIAAGYQPSTWPGRLARAKLTVVRRALVLVGAVALTRPAAAQDVEAARRAALTSEYQPTLPQPPSPPADVPVTGGTGGTDGAGGGAAGSGSAAGSRKAPARPPPPRREGTRDELVERRTPMATLLHFLLWGALVVGGLLVLAWLASELVRRRGERTVLPDDKEAARPDRAVIERPLDDAAELARRGDYNAAIHTLLLRTLQELVRSTDVRVSPAHTSREILARVPLAPAARDALGGLIVAVELTHFGADLAGVADYERCLARFRVFADAFGGAA